MGASAGGSALKLWASDQPFPEACSVRRVQIAAPTGWIGKTALFLTDIHYNNYFGEAEAAALNRIVRRHAPDVVLMGGDLAHTPHTDLTGFFSHWSPGCPTLFALGNHDMAAPTDDRIMQQAREGGMVTLCNKAENWNGITFIGFPSALVAAQRTSLLQSCGTKILLAHEPDTWDRFAESELLQLAGHTHGGQVRLWNGPIFLPPLGRKYPLGSFARGATRRLIVSAGLGCTTVHARINCPPEIVQLSFV